MVKWNLGDEVKIKIIDLERASTRKKIEIGLRRESNILLLAL